VTDPKLADAWFGGGPIIPPWSLMHLKALDTHTVRIDWTAPYDDYLTALAQLTPLPLHVYVHGPFKEVYDPATDAYNSTLAQQMAAQDSFNLQIPGTTDPSRWRV
jgi:hypothetical protein